MEKATSIAGLAHLACGDGCCMVRDGRRCIRAVGDGDEWDARLDCGPAWALHETLLYNLRLDEDAGWAAHHARSYETLCGISAAAPARDERRLVSETRRAMRHANVRDHSPTLQPSVQSGKGGG